MIRFNHSNSGKTIKGLVAGGMLAAAMGLAVSQSATPYGSGSSGANPGSAQDQTMSSPGAPAQTGGQANPNPSDASMPGSVSANPNAAGAASAINTNTGWRIRVCSEKTKAQSINFNLSPVGSSGSAKQSANMPSTESYPGASMPGAASPDLSSTTGSSPSGTAATSGTSATGAAMGPETASWNRGEATLIPVPGSLGDADKIRVEAIPGEKNQKASVCLLYNDHVAKKLNFDDREVSTVKKTQTGECGC